jgi:hypothetical protein
LKKIEESPDSIYISIPGKKNKTKKIASWILNEAYAFGYYRNKLYISKAGDTHFEIIQGEILRGKFKYSGRLWKKKKLISFWNYPETSADMKRIADDIDKTFYTMYNEKLDIWNTFKVEILIDKQDNNKVYKKFNDTGTIPKGVMAKLINVKDYEKSGARSPEELEIPHIMTPMDKFRKGIKMHAPGFGAEKRYSLPSKYADKVGKGYNLKDIPAFIHHQIQRTSDGIIKLKKLVESPDTFIIPKRRKLHPFDEDAYSFGYFEGNLYISDYSETHGELLSGDSSDDLEINRYDLEYPGRLWIKSKVISFWNYPKSNGMMKKIVDDISYKYNQSNDKSIDIWNNFKVDIIVNNKTGEIYHEYSSDFGTIPDFCHMEIIPVKDYKKDISYDKISKQKRFDIPLSKIDKVGKGYKLDDIPAFIKHGIERTSDGTIKLKSLIENTIAKVSKDINVIIDIDKTVHAGQRQFRHKTPISDKEIIDIVGIALPEITNKLMFDEINMGSYVLIKHRGTMINIVGALQHVNNGVIDFVVVTAMKKKDFIPKRNTKVIEV